MVEDDAEEEAKVAEDSGAQLVDTNFSAAMELSVDSTLSPAMLAIVRDDDLADLQVGVAGPLGRYATLILNVADAAFERRGTVGRGRCAISFCDLAMTNYSSYTDLFNNRRIRNVVPAMLRRCDQIRADYRLWYGSLGQGQRTTVHAAILACGAGSS
jgi:hypothetical protein